jgi:hypothetical protein
MAAPTKAAMSSTGAYCHTTARQERSEELHCWLGTCFLQRKSESRTRRRTSDVSKRSSFRVDKNDERNES